MDQSFEKKEILLAGGTELPPGLEKPQKIDNPKKQEPDSLPEWREIELNGVRGRITSEKLEVEVDGIKAVCRVLVADFRETGDEIQNVMISCAGFPGLNEGLRTEYLRGEFAKPASQASLELAGFEAATANKGILFIPELQTLPIDRKKKKQSFLADAVVIEKAIEETMARRSADRPMKPLVGSDEISLSGYSNGAGEAGAMAAVLSSKLGEKGKIKLRLYSLIGIVPVPDVAMSFGKEVWAVTMVELSERYEKLFGVKHDPNTMDGQKKLLGAVGAVFTTSEGRAKFVEEIKKSLKGGQEGGNLQIGIDLLRKVLKDVSGTIPHQEKYDNPDYSAKWGRNVAFELVVPKFDRTFWNNLLMMMFEGAKKTGDTEALTAVLAETGIGEAPPVLPGRWWRGLFGDVGSFSMAVIGEKLGEPLATHTGIVGDARRFIEAKLQKY